MHSAREVLANNVDTSQAPYNERFDQVLTCFVSTLFAQAHLSEYLL